MKYKSVRGMEDILPEDIAIWQYLEKTARIDLMSYGYKEIRTPLLEDTDVFVRSIGKTTDIVKKEMYTFEDKKGRSLTLRPEGTAPIVRSYIEHSLDKTLQDSKFYYIGPMFRSERPQRGRTRQFHQIGVEVFGSRSPYADAEVIMQLNKMLDLFGLKDFTIKLNSLGCKKDKENFASELKKYLKDKETRLCADCKARIKRNVLRVLDCKIDSCIQVARGAPNVLDSLCNPCKDHYESLKKILNSMKIDFKETKNLVRGLDYYTGTVFEITHPALGAQDAIGAGGRYDNLVKDMGGADIAAIGYALGIERIIIALKKDLPESKDIYLLYIATLGDAAKIHGIQIAEELRSKLPNFIISTDLKEASLKSQLRSASKSNAKFVLIIGEDEIKKDMVIFKDMSENEQKEIKKEDIPEEIKRRIKC